MPLVVGVQELVLDLGHVHLGGALRLAGLALQAQVKHVVHSLAGELILGEQAGDCCPEGVGAAPGGVLLLTGSHVGGTHRAVEGPATESDSVAHLHRSVETALGGEAEFGGGRKARVGRAVPEVFHNTLGVHDLAGIHDAGGIEGAFDVPEGVVEA